MDYLPHLAVKATGTLLWVLVLLLSQVSLVTGSVPTINNAVVCLVSDGPDILQDELYLHCKTAGVINILSARHGFREQAEDVKSCGPEQAVPGACFADHAAFRREVLNRCMGVSKCYVPVQKVYMDDCDMYSNYVQVEYECVPDNSVEPDNIVDICGEMMQGSQVSRLSGYIKTPDYPDLYPPDISCSCNLTALSDSHAQITLTLLDIQLEEPRDRECEWDWLEYTTATHGWGRGTKVCQQPHHTGINNTFTGNKTVLLNFRADNKVENRGFWLKYEGRSIGGEEVEVLLQCKNFQPNIIRRDMVCIDDGGNAELFLDCGQEKGVINVLNAQYGRRSTEGISTADAQECSYLAMPECMTSATTDDNVLRTCMGQSTCILPVRPQPLPPCGGGATSDFLQVKYQCIPAAYEPTNIVDICGDMLNGGAPFRHSGYIQSPNYPQMYPPQLRCQCLLSTDSNAHVRLRLLDIKLRGDSVTAACDADWLRFTTSHAAEWGSGRGLCHEPRDRLIDTAASEIRLDFNSDRNVEDRGFWVHYSALRPDGLHVGVQIMCRQYKDGKPSDEVLDTARPLKPSNFNTGLAAGLSVITILILVVILVLLILKFRRMRKGKMSETASTTSSNTPVFPEKPLNSALPRYSNYGPNAQQNYRTLHTASQLPPPLQCDPQRDYVEQHPDYDVTDDVVVTGTSSSLSSAGSANPSYVNPAFDGSLEPSSHSSFNPQNVTC